MKVLFLDLDGVVNSHDWFRRRMVEQPTGNYWERQIDPHAVSLLNEIIEATGAKVVVSSTWRKNHTLQELRAGLSSRDFRGEIIAVTGEDLSAIRGREIQKWLDDYKNWGGYRPLDVVERFAIVDDDSDMEHLRPHLIQTNFELGLTAIQATKIISHLRWPNTLAGREHE